MATKSNWKAILAVYLIGVAAAAQVGRIVPAANSLREDMAMGLSTYGWMVSLITCASAVLGLVAGYWVVRRGPRFALFAGLTVLFVGLVVATASPSMTVMLFARVAEGLGYLAIVVAAPTLIAREASAKDSARSLALWGTFFPLGISTAAITGGLLSELFGWRVWFGVNAAVLLPVAVLALVSVPADPGTPQQRSSGADGRQLLSLLPVSAWLIGLGLLSVTLITLALLSMLPVFLMERHEHSQRTAGGITGAVAMTSILGSLLYGWVANRISENRIVLGAAALLLASAFPAFHPAAAVPVTVAFAALAIFATGVLVASVFAAVPRLVPSPERIGPANGLIAQIGSVGALTGPPIIGFFIATSGWTALPVMIVIFTLSFVGFAISANAAQR
ncbi:MAG: hypothetical protein CME00_00105 [Geminicoccus sp.]|nr:hypothetical protein [Geminicoccus sp.]HCH99990.1 hypothetical protein [Alphaproteobacteria bacterium]